jgi:nucleotide-binding universal stress UspA family protein
MEPSTQHRFRIVVGLDLSDYSEIVLEHAIDQAARHDNPDLHFIHAIADGGDVDDAKTRLGGLVLPLLSDLSNVDWRARLHVRGGLAEQAICDLAAELRADLIVVGRFGVHRRRGRRALGAIASRVLARASCPTLAVGMTEEVAPSDPVCDACAAVREESDGEQWFCERHRAVDRTSFASVFVPGPIWTGGGLLW